MNEGTENTKIGWGRLILESLLEGVGEVLEKEPEEEPHKGFWTDDSGQERYGDRVLT